MREAGARPGPGPGRSARAALVLAVAGLGLAGCGGPAETGPAAAGPASRAASDPGRGELLALACRACHTLERGAEHSIGPNLHGVFGRRAGALEDYEYSAALAEAGFVWTPERLQAWLAEPVEYVPGTTMTFTGYRSAADRRALIVYLERVTALPEPASAP